MNKVSNKISKEWTANRRVAVEKYIKEIQNILRLSDWTIIVDWSEPCEEISLATNDPHEEQKYAIIRVSDKLIDMPQWLQTQTLVHELVHCHLQQVTDLAEYTVKALSSKSTNQIFLIAYNQVVELATDAIADAIHPLVPQFQIPDKIVTEEDINLFGSYDENLELPFNVVNDSAEMAEQILINKIDIKKTIKNEKIKLNRKRVTKTAKKSPVKTKSKGSASKAKTKKNVKTASKPVRKTASKPVRKTASKPVKKSKSKR